MTTIAIVLEQGGGQPTFSAVAAERQATGRTAGEALDALNSQLGVGEAGAPIIVQEFRPDEFFPAEQRDRLSELMALRREAREKGSELPPSELVELESLVEEETRGATGRAALISRDFEAAQQRLKRERTARRLSRAQKTLRTLDLLLGVVLAICAGLILFVLASGLGLVLLSTTVLTILSVSALAGLFTLLVAVGRLLRGIVLSFRFGDLHAEMHESSTERGEHRGQNDAR